MSTNWIHQQKAGLTTNDKVVSLLQIKNKLVLVQVHELERIKAITDKTKYTGYVEQLYKHYITLNLPKTYLM